MCFVSIFFFYCNFFKKKNINATIFKGQCHFPQIIIDYLEQNVYFRANNTKKIHPSWILSAIYGISFPQSMTFKSLLYVINNGVVIFLLTSYLLTIETSSYRISLECVSYLYAQLCTVCILEHKNISLVTWKFSEGVCTPLLTANLQQLWDTKQLIDLAVCRRCKVHCS